MIPVVPAAHYLCGGVRTNLRAETSLPGLYACGEVACTGLHGANRLAATRSLRPSSSPHRGAQAVGEYLATARASTLAVPDWVDGSAQDPDERVVLTHNSAELKQAMWDYVGIVRTTKRLSAPRAPRSLAREVEEYYWNFKSRATPPRTAQPCARRGINCRVRAPAPTKAAVCITFWIYPEKLPEATDTVVHKK